MIGWGLLVVCVSSYILFISFVWIPVGWLFVWLRWCCIWCFAAIFGCCLYVLLVVLGDWLWV